jgi:hypothetical protein
MARRDGAAKPRTPGRGRTAGAAGRARLPRCRSPPSADRLVDPDDRDGLEALGPRDGAREPVAQPQSKTYTVGSSAPLYVFQLFVVAPWFTMTLADHVPTTVLG